MDKPTKKIQCPNCQYEFDWNTSLCDDEGKEEFDDHPGFGTVEDLEKTIKDISGLDMENWK